MTKTYEVTFERLGRNHDLAPVTIVGNEDVLAARLLKFCGKHLVSRAFDITVDFDAGTGVVEYGRFGTFTIREVA